MSTWDFSNYILRGEYCSPDEARVLVEQIAESVGAEAYIHLAFDHQYVLKSLVCCGFTTGTGILETLDAWLHEADFKNVNTVFNAIVVDGERRVVAKSIADQIGPRRLTGLLQAIAAVTIHERELPFSIPDRLWSRRWKGWRLNHTGDPKFAPRDGEPRSLLLLEGDSLDWTRVRRSQIVELGVMLKCTAQANARRDSVVMERVRKMLRPAEPDSEHLDFQAVAVRSINLACDITGASAGAIYLQNHLDSAAFTRHAVVQPAEIEFPLVVRNDSSMALAWSILRHRAWQQMSGTSATFELNRTVSAANGTELITPIPGPLADVADRAIGALVLYSPEEEPRGFTSYERALIRNICLRLATLHSSLATRQIADAIAELRRLSPRRLGPRHSSNAESQVSGGMPHDIVLAVREFDRPLQALASATNSHSVVVRILLPDTENGGKSGLALYRAAAFQSKLLSPTEYPVHRSGDPGPHWDVLSTGNYVYIEDSEVDRRYSGIRPETSSSLCVPLRVEGIITGTLNLESPFEAAYAPFAPLVEAMAGALGRTLADGRAASESEVLQTAAYALSRKHQYAGELTRARQFVQDISDSDRASELDGLLDNMEQTVTDLRVRPSLTDFESGTLWETCASEIARSKLMLSGATKPDDDLYHRALTSSATHALAMMFRQLLSNIVYHRGIAGPPSIRFKRMFLDGRQHAVISLKNSTKLPMTASRCIQIYRYPVKDRKGVTRLGTYIAGLNARSAGIIIHARPRHNGKTFKTTIIIPVEDLEHERG